jgi:hypothetical protein
MKGARTAGALCGCVEAVQVLQRPPSCAGVGHAGQLALRAAHREGK